ncbi:MAG TPA: hypothetical protein VMC03_18265 [Streptosporangiaceae bacterium]|jgi:hypothetical protein|nr:hypothetical protein [Streptosporangiaceae bacterium]
MHGKPPSVKVVDSAVTPAPEPFGRAIEQVVSVLLLPFVTIVSPTAPVFGLTASQLYSLFLGLVAL